MAGSSAQPVTEPSAEILRTAREAGLGEHFATCAPTPVAQRRDVRAPWPAFVILGVVGGGFLVGGLANGEAFFFILAFGLLGFGALGALPRYFSRGIVQKHQADRMYFFASGLIVTNLGRVFVFPWDRTTALQGITNHIHAGHTYLTTYTYTLVAPDGDAVILGDASPLMASAHVATYNAVRGSEFAHPEEWGPAIQQAVTDAQLPKALQAIESGRTVTFGPISMNRTAVEANGKTVPWSRIQQLKVDKGVVSIKVEGRWTALVREQVFQIPNFFVFNELATRLHGAEHR